MTSRARLVAFYLPQFHPIPENDKWWGKGYTEWTNTAKASPMFRGHYQPHVPADLGFYDLRVPETRQVQADLAKDHGIEGFCYYHYWFGGKLLLERPLAEVVTSGRPDFPFCVCWANQTWGGIWHGAPDRVLIEQTYPGDHDHRAHFAYLLPAFADPRYITVNGQPVFVIYRPRQLPDAARTTDLWREMAVRAGLKGLHLIGVDDQPQWNAAQFGFDASTCTRFPPRRGGVPTRNPVRRTRERLDVMRGLPTVYTYRDALGALWPVPTGTQLSYPTVIHAWDNSPRSGMNGLVLRDSDPELFRLVLRRAIELRSEVPLSERIVFLKSWNEWAEGNHLEPDLRYGRAFLQVIREEVSWADQRLERVGVAPAPRRGVQLSAPPLTISHLQMEPTTRCNFTCGFCWGRHLVQEDIAVETAAKALRSIPTLKTLMFQGEGEPLLHRRWHDIVSMARGQDIEVALYTNGSLLHGENVQKILDLRLSKVMVSIESTDEAQFKAIRGGDLPRILEGIRLLLDERRRRDQPEPAVGFAVTILRSTIEQLPRIFELYQKLDMDGGIAVQPLQSKPSYTEWYSPEMRSEVLSPEESQVAAESVSQLREEWLGADRNSLPARPSLVEQLGSLWRSFFGPRQSGRAGCWWLNEGVYLRANGAFTPCCFIKDHSLGQVEDLDLSAVLENRWLLQDQLLAGQVPEPCSGCEVAETIVRRR